MAVFRGCQCLVLSEYLPTETTVKENILRNSQGKAQSRWTGGGGLGRRAVGVRLRQSAILLYSLERPRTRSGWTEASAGARHYTSAQKGPGRGAVGRRLLQEHEPALQPRKAQDDEQFEWSFCRARSCTSAQKGPGRGAVELRFLQEHDTTLQLRKAQDEERLSEASAGGRSCTSAQKSPRRRGKVGVSLLQSTILHISPEGPRKTRSSWREASAGARSYTLAKKGPGRRGEVGVRLLQRHNPTLQPRRPSMSRSGWSETSAGARHCTSAQKGPGRGVGLRLLQEHDPAFQPRKDQEGNRLDWGFCRAWPCTSAHKGSRGAVRLLQEHHPAFQPRRDQHEERLEWGFCRSTTLNFRPKGPRTKSSWIEASAGARHYTSDQKGPGRGAVGLRLLQEHDITLQPRRAQEDEELELGFCRGKTLHFSPDSVLIPKAQVTVLLQLPLSWGSAVRILHPRAMEEKICGPRRTANAVMRCREGMLKVAKW
jgi:hypothetical protein